MKAVRIHSYGNKDVLVYEDAPVPQVQDDEVLIRVHASSVNPFDWKVRQGYLAGYFNYSLPLILGWDVSGVVECVGPDVQGFSAGDEVYARAPVHRDGASAEYIAVPAEEVAYKPRTVDHSLAAAVPNAALAAWNALVDVGKLEPGQHVLIHAAAGGVGTFAVQLAKWLGAEVTGTASRANYEFLEQIGVDHVIDYATAPFEDVVRDVDVVLDSIGGETLQRCWPVLRPGGILVSIIENPAEETASARGVRAAMASAQAGRQRMEQIASLVDQGVLKPQVTAIFPLSEMREAHAQSETMHTRGKIVIQIA